MKILAVDPGTLKSGVVIYNATTNTVEAKGIISNEEVIDWICRSNYNQLVVERVLSYGMPIGKSTIETIEWIGEFRAWAKIGQIDYYLLPRKDVKLILCGSMRAKDANIIQAVKDHFPATGGGKDPYKGTKKQPGHLYGIASHMWQALALAVAFNSLIKSGEL